MILLLNRISLETTFDAEAEPKLDVDPNLEPIVPEKTESKESKETDTETDTDTDTTKEIESTVTQETDTETDTAEDMETTGQIISIKDGVAFVTGLPQIKVGEIVEFVGKNIYGMALNLEKDRVGCIVFGDDYEIKQDDEVICLNRLVDVAVGDQLLGRVTDGLGIVIDGREDITEVLERKNVERKAPGVITRKTVTEPMLTGYKIVDSMLPIGRGQRELIVGDRQTGKTTIAVDTILNQQYYNKENIEVFCIYVGMDRKKILY
jgi:F-type H+-transporting ATPase subunit alpha